MENVFLFENTFYRNMVKLQLSTIQWVGKLTFDRLCSHCGTAQKCISSVQCVGKLTLGGIPGKLS